MQLEKREDAHWSQHATAQDVPSVECAKDGIAVDQIAQRLCALASPTNEPLWSFGERAISFAFILFVFLKKKSV